jgi:septin 3/9/12
MYPYDNDEFDDEERALNAVIKNKIPFAVVGSEKTLTIDGKPVRARQNKWGTITLKMKITANSSISATF